MTAISLPVDTTLTRPTRRRSARQKLVTVGHCLALLAILLFCVFPFYWMVSSSFKQQADALASPPLWLFTPTLENFTFSRPTTSIFPVPSTRMRTGLALSPCPRMTET